MKLIIILYLVLCSSIHFSYNCKSIVDPYTYVLSGDGFAWPSRSIRRMYSSSGRMIPRNIIPTRFQTLGLYAVVTFPRLRPGVPITLGRVPLIVNQRVPKIEPFPSWEMQEEGNAEAIQNAVDIFLDENGILWVLDTGIINTLTYPEEIGSPKVLGINFITGKIKYEIDLSRYGVTNSKFQYVVAENTLGRPFVYVSCAETCSVIVCDVLKDSSKRVNLPNPAGKSDVLYMVLLKPAGRPMVMAFSHLSYPTLLGIEIPALRRGFVGDILDLGNKKGEMVILGTDNISKIYFRWKGDCSVRAWEIGDKKGEEGSVVSEGDGCRASTQVAEGSRCFTWSLESNFQDFVRGNHGNVGASAVLKPLMKEKFEKYR